MRLSFEANAVQWFKEGDHPRVHVPPRSIRVCYDVAYVDGLFPMSSCWMTLEPIKVQPPATKGIFSPMVARFVAEDGSLYWRKVWPFSFFSMKGDKVDRVLDQTDPADRAFFDDFEFVEREMNKNRLEQYPRRPYGKLNPPATDGRIAVFPGDWIVESQGHREVLSDADFQKRYNQEPQ